jgi:hypothetical protein
MTDSRLLELDGIGNVLLGLPLLLFPGAVSRFIGLPSTPITFYPIILGAIFIGIGIALLMERFKPKVGGLRIAGAMSINLVFGIVLGVWLVGDGASIPLRGALVLWALVLVLVAISLAELYLLQRAKTV